LGANFMGDSSSSVGAENAPKTNDKREPLPRLVYLSLRLKELAADLQAMVTERQKLNATLKDHAGDPSKDVRKMRERRGYLAIRINILRAEQQGLAAEKEGLAPLAVSLSGGGGQDVGVERKTKAA